MFLNKPIRKEIALSEPNYEFIARQIQCDFILHPRELKESTSRSPYAEVKSTYLKISSTSFRNSQASKNLSCFEFADTYFFSHVKSSLNEVNELYLPIETKDKWSLEFKVRNKNFQLGEHERKEKLANEKVSATEKKRKRNQDIHEEEKEVDWVVFSINFWMKEKKKVFFDKLFKKDFLIKHIKNDYNDYNFKRGNEKFDEKNFVDYLLNTDRHNPRGDLFERANIVRCLSTLLSGIICHENPSNDNEQSSEDELIDTLGVLVKTNGVITPDFDSINLTTSLKSAWLTELDGKEFHYVNKYAVSSNVSSSVIVVFQERFNQTI
jgi:hypothetical protein